MGDGDQHAPARPSAWLRTAGAFLVFGLGLVLRLLTVIDDEERRPVGPAAERDPGVHVRTVAPGTCVAEVYPRDYVHPVPCTQPHPTEIVSLPRYPGPPGDDFPAIRDLYRQSFAMCKAAFNAYTGTTPDQTPARFGAVLPVGYEWEGGERLVVCYAEGRNGVLLTNSLRKT